MNLNLMEKFGGPHVDQPISKKYLGQMPHLHVEFSDVEEEQLDPEVEKDQESELDIIEEEKGPVVDGQTKSWWHRQVKKVVKGMGTFRLCLKRCLGVKTSKKPVARLINLQPVNSTIISMNIGKPPSLHL